MKALAILALTLGIPLSSYAASASELYTEAQRAHLAGDTELAKAKYIEVLKISPRHVQARNYLRIIQSKERANPGGSTQKQLNTLVLKELKLDDASLSSVLDLIRQRANEDSNGTLVLNFVSLLSPEVMENTKVTLQLASVPYSVALTYIGDIAKVKFDYQQHAIVVTPTTKAVTATQPTTASDPNSAE